MPPETKLYVRLYIKRLLALGVKPADLPKFLKEFNG